MQLGLTRLPVTQEIASSNLVGPAIFIMIKLCKAILNAEIAQSVEQWTENPRVPSSILGLGTRFFCGNSSVVEHRLAKARVAGSNPVFRSIFIKIQCGGIAKW